jgi:thiol:disulfide interchange protein DsbC
MRKRLILLLLASSSLFANNDIDKAIIQQIVPNTKIAGITQATSSLSAVCTQDSKMLFYVNKNDSTLFFGEIWSNTGENLSQKLHSWCDGLVATNPVSFENKVSSLKNNGLKIINGTGAKNGIEFVIFKSPTCHYCQELGEFLNKTNTTSYEYMAPSLESVAYYKKYTNDPKELLKKQQKIVTDLKIEIDAVPLTLVVKDNKVLEVIKGADLIKFRKYLY